MKHQQEQTDDGKQRKDSWSIRKLRGQELLMDNKAAEKKIIKLVGSPAFSDATLHDFSKLKLPQLSAFIKCRILADLTSPETVQMKLPKKGSLKAAEEDDSDEPETLIRWAFNLRDYPASAIVPDAPPADNTNEISTEEQQALIDDSTYLLAVNSQREESICEMLEATEDALEAVEELSSDDDNSMSSDGDDSDGDWL
jgi:hypothetical protein